jgi:hypothetical protein
VSRLAYARDRQNRNNDATHDSHCKTPDLMYTVLANVYVSLSYHDSVLLSNNKSIFLLLSFRASFVHVKAPSMMMKMM